ncbi:hypothetical protein [Streptomyces sp. NPDC052496]|uniref:hypothetical protein n=1 Tax=Streptomyces sp. NPDC052496 TaxID=3154951 RepID=UPI003414E44A
MSCSRWSRFVVPVCAVAGAGCVLSWAGAAAGVTPSVLPAPQVKVSRAETDLCPTPAVAKALADQGVTLGAKSPASTVDVGGRRCVRLPMTRGEFALDLSTGSVPADGGITFTKQSAGKTVTFADPTFDFATHKANGTSTDGTKAGRGVRQQPVELFGFAFQMDKTKVDVAKGTAQGAASLNAGPGGQQALKDAFGTSPLPAQGTVFDATATGSVAQAARQAARALSGILLPYAG